MPPTIRILWKIFYDLFRKFLTTTSSLKHGTEVGSAPPTMSTGLQSIQWLRRKKVNLCLSGIGTTALWWWTWTEVGDVLWFLEISWETPEFSGWILIFESLNYYFSWNSLFRQVQALPRPQVRHVGLQTPEAVQALLPCSVRHLQRCHRQVGPILSLSGTLLLNVLTMLRQNMVVDNVLTDIRCNEDTIIDAQADQAPAGPGWVDQAAWWACSPSPAKRPGAGFQQKHCFHISL